MRHTGGGVSRQQWLPNANNRADGRKNRFRHGSCREGDENLRMRYGIAMAGDRVAPRGVFAESVLVVVLRRNVARPEATAPLEDHGLLDLAKVLSESRVDVLVCGGISNEEREFLAGRGVEIVDNVAGSIRELLDALQAGSLRPGFGLVSSDGNVRAERLAGPALAEAPDRHGVEPVDCVACRDHKCMRGERCKLAMPAGAAPAIDPEIDRMSEASLDISSEKERTLCRLSELIYFCLEMRYRRIGLAYCVDLLEPAETLTRVLRRFFTVYPVCCKVGGFADSDPLGEKGQRPARQVACNPRGQAEVLNHVGTDVNVLVGLCMGADCIFARFSEAPVTTLFVKDKSLANNPIGAVYSDYYLKEAAQAAWCSAGEVKEQV
jgi:uncharacterized metal-binding protein/predicted Fe-Mo cluster-binding NifX family protein